VQVKGFSEYLKRFKNFIDFKIENPYCEKNLEFEVSPTPRSLSLNGPKKVIEKYDISRYENIMNMFLDDKDKMHLPIRAVSDPMEELQTINHLTKNDMIKMKHYVGVKI